MENTEKGLTVTGGQVPAFVQEKLASLNGALEYAATLLKSGIAPAHFYQKDQYNKPDYTKGKPEAVVIVLQYGSEIGMSPMQALQQLIPVNNLVALKGDGAKALIQRSGKLSSWQETEIGTQGKDDWGFKIEASRKDTNEKASVSFTVMDARRAGLWIDENAVNKNEKLKHSPWFKHPRRMLRYRALGFIARDLFSDVLSGIYTEEEASDIDVDNTKYKTDEGLVIDIVKETKVERNNDQISEIVEKKVSKKKELAGAVQPKVEIKPEPIQEAVIIPQDEHPAFNGEPAQETKPEPTGLLAPAISMDAYDNKLKTMEGKGLVEEFNSHKKIMGFGSDEWKELGAPRTLPVIREFLSQVNRGNMDSHLEKIGVDKLKLLTLANGKSESVSERGMEEQVKIMDKIEESGLDPDAVATELGYGSSEEMYQKVDESTLNEFLERNSGI